MKNRSKTLFAIFLTGLVALTTFDLLAAVAPYPPEEMMEEATHVVEGKVIALSSKTQKSRRRSSRSDFLIARDRIFKITVKVAALKKGKGLKQGEELTFEAWQPSTRFPPLPGPQGHQPVPDKGDEVKAYLLFDEKSKTYHPLMPNGITILPKTKNSK